VGHIPSHLHSTCTLPRHLNPFHPHHPSLSCGEDLDPTSSWVLALLRESARSLCPHRCLPTLFPPIHPHSTRPLCCPPSSKLRLFPPQSPKNHTPLFHGSLGLHRRQFPVPTQVGQCSWLLGWAWRSPTPSPQPPPRKPQTEYQDQTDPCSCVPPSSITPRFHPNPHCHPQRSPPCPLPAHTRGGSVCGRGGVRWRFCGWASVSGAHAHPH
jgi:hypothetical protein